MENLAQLEALCEGLYKSQDSSERAYAENTLKCFSLNTNYISECEYILGNARNPYALLLASSSLLKQVTQNKLPLQLRLHIRDHVVNYLATKSPNLEPFVIGSLIQLLCRVTKVSWFDDDRFKELEKVCVNFLVEGSHHFTIGLKVLNQLISEMNQRNAALAAIRERKVAASFRDHSLLQIYQISLTSLSELKNTAESNLQELSLSLSLKCLSFDFLGISDETADELGCTQVPKSWGAVIEESSTLQIYFDYYAIKTPPLSKEALECLVLLASVRKSTFTNDAARLKFLASLMAGTKGILESGKGLGEHDNYHEFCRLLGRFKVHYQLSDLVSTEGCNAWIDLVAGFTVKSLQSWQWASGSIYYLLGLWSKMVTAIPYLKADCAIRLDEFVHNIVETFISSRFGPLEAGISEDPSEDPLNDVELMQNQLDFFPILCRYQYGSCSSYIMKIMDSILRTYMEGANFQDIVGTHKLAAVESKLAWMVHLVAALLKVKRSTGLDSQESADAEISARVLQLINIIDTGLHTQRYSEESKQRLELAVLIFFQNFSKSYIGDQALCSSKQFYVRLSELLGLHDHALVLSIIVRKIVTNLKCYPGSKKVIDQTLTLFREIASGLSSLKLLLQLDSIQYIMFHHNREQFPFLEDYSCTGRRTTFYHIIGLLIFKEEKHAIFKCSMDSFSQVFASLESTPDSMLRSNPVKHLLIGLTRDLRGIAQATSSRRTYGFLFSWLYPSHFLFLLKATALWADSPEVTTPLLKFMAEMVENRYARLTFDSSSPNGILLFREVSKLIVAYGSTIPSLPNQVDLYAFKYKGISISLAILSKVFLGNYVNFGVLELYGDRALSDALDCALRMIQSIPVADILAYRKVAKAYFTFVDLLLGNLVNFASNLDMGAVLYIVTSLDSGLKALDSNIVSQCASAFNHMATCYFNNIIVGDAPASQATLNFARRVSDCPDVFPNILKTLFEIALFEDTSTLSDLSKPILSLILISEEMYTNVKTQIIDSQPLERECLQKCFDNLMVGVNKSLDFKNRDKFYQNLAKIKAEIHRT